MHGIARYAVDMLQSDLARRHRITPFADQIPFGLRPKAPTARHTWNVIARDGFVATTRVASFALKTAWRIDRELASGRHDVMHILSTAGYGFFRNSLHMALARRHGVRTVFHLLGQFDDLIRGAGPSMLRVIHRCLDLGDVHVVQSPGLAGFLRRHTTRPVHAIFNGVAVDELTPPDGYAHSPGGRVRLLALGVLGHKKGTYDLLDAAERLKNRLPNLDFVFVGAGEVEQFRALARAKGLTGRATFLGSVDDAARVRALHESDIFAIPSRAEGQPIALLEAMAAGLPVIASRVGSVPEVVQPTNGFLVEPGDVEALVTAIARLARDARLRETQGRFSAEEASKKYRLSRVMDEIDAVYHDLMQGQHD